jgi:prophage antirepressor-like protein
MAIVTAHKWENGQLFLNGEVVPILFFGEDFAPWFKAKPVHNYLGAANITQTLVRVDPRDKASLKDLVELHGVPKRGVMSDITPPDHTDYNEGKAMYLNESGLYTSIMGSLKPVAKPFQRWVTSEVLPSIRKTGSYSLTQRNEDISMQLLRPWLESRLNALEGMVRASTSSAPPHGVLEITRSRSTSFSKRLLEIGTPVDDSHLATIAAEGGPLHVSVFLQDMGVRHDLIRRLMPTFSTEVGRRKLDQYNRAEGIKPPLWIAWSQGAWRLYYTEADRELFCAAFEDPLTKQNMSLLERSCQAARSDAPVVARLRSGPYRRVPRGGSNEASSESIRRFFQVRADA